MCYIIILYGGLQEAERINIIQKNPLRLMEKKDRIKKQDIFRSSFTIEQLQKLVETPLKIPQQYKQSFLFSCFSGLRWSDTNPLKWSEIIEKEIEGKEKWFIYFEQEKTEAVEYLPLSQQAVAIIKQRMEARKHESESEYVFPLVKEINEKSQITYQRVKRAIKTWGKKAGFNPDLMHFHAGRHTFATNVLEHSPDGDLYTVSKLLGHKNINSTQVYAKVRDKRRAAAVDSCQC